MNVGRKKPIWPSPRCMDKLRSDLKEHQVDPKLAQKMEELKKAIITIDPGRDALRTGIRSAKVQHVCVIIYVHVNPGAFAFLTAVLWCKQKYDVRRRFPFSILCASVVCRSEMSPSFRFCHVDMLRQLPKT